MISEKERFRLRIMQMLLDLIETFGLEFKDVSNNVTCKILTVSDVHDIITIYVDDYFEFTRVKVYYLGQQHFYGEIINSEIKVYTLDKGNWIFRLQELLYNGNETSDCHPQRFEHGKG